MNTVLPLLGLLLELVLAVLVFIWTIAFLGFLDEAKRSQKVTFWGRLLVITFVGISSLPTLFTLGVAYQHFFQPDSIIFLGLWLPLVAILICGIICSGLLFLVKHWGYSQKKQRK